jgi:uncharacterized protein (DUF697 family)
MNPFAPSQTRILRLLINLFLARFSPQDIERATRVPLRIGVAGDADLIEGFKELLVGGAVSKDEPFPSLSLHPLPADERSHHWHILEDCQSVVVLLQREHLLGDTLYRIKDALPKKIPSLFVAVGQVEPWLRYEVGEIARELKLGGFVWVDDLTESGAKPLLREFIKVAGGSELALARKLPAIRDFVAGRIIARTARQNLFIAMASALPSSIPWVGPIIGLLGVSSEIIFLTSNQIKMVLQVACVYGMEPDVQSRAGELLSIAGGAFGWRALSRELVGLIPLIGPGVKGSVAFAGTSATGEAARWYYRNGQMMSAEERKRIFDEALAKGTELTEKVKEMLPATAVKAVEEWSAKEADELEKIEDQQETHAAEAEAQSELETAGSEVKIAFLAEEESEENSSQNSGASSKKTPRPRSKKKE